MNNLCFFYIPKNALRQKIQENQLKNPVYIDLFAGCGGLSLGLNQAGWKGLFAVEKSPHAFETLKHNLIDKLDHFDWPDWLPVSPLDINDLINDEREKLLRLRGTVDLVTGGPPCQGFSSAGLRKENDQRNELIRSYLRFISYVRPKLIFFENVKGFTLEFKKNRTKGYAYSAYVSEVLRRLGYDVEGRLIDFSQYGIPQKRTRFILVAVLKEFSASSSRDAKLFFKSIKRYRTKFLVSKELRINTSLEQAISDLLMAHGKVDSPDSKGFKAGLYSYNQNPYQKLLRKNVSDCEIPDSHRFVNHSSFIVRKFKAIINSGGDLDKINPKYLTKKHSQQLLKGKNQSPTLTTLPDDYIHYREPRILTVREYARIQSFPDWYKFRGKYTTGGEERVMEVPRYTQIGNAIPPLFAEQSGQVLKGLAS